MAKATPSKYRMRISRMTVDKLGVKLYDRVSAVLAELVSNSYDADATEVIISAPMDGYLASKAQGRIRDLGYKIVVEDNGIGMTPDEINQFYLRVGAERRRESKRGRGDTSPNFKRKVMGRKGVGKLAPFGICQKIEVISSGGTSKIVGKDSSGKSIRGFPTAHLILDRDVINKDEDFDYEPEIGPQDGTVSAKTGSRITLSGFAYRSVPKIEELGRQLAQRFGIESADWKILLKDSSKTASASDAELAVGSFSVDLMEGTKITFPEASSGAKALPFAIKPDGNKHATLKAGFTCDGKTYQLSGWVAYARHAYKDDLMAGVRIYCRGKIAAQTSAFDHKSGFEGEFTVRSYLVGELHADWLDTDEDLIQTDRRDILWSDELGKGFQEWGREIVGEIGKITRNPMRIKLWDLFQEKSKIQSRAAKAYPGDDNKAIRDNAIGIAARFGKAIRESEVEDEEVIENVVQMSLMLAPHLTLDDKLKEAADSQDGTFAALTSILKTAMVAELAAYGQIARDRVRVIGRLENLMEADKTVEGEFQSLLEEAPWLVHAEWHPVTMNEGFKVLKKRFEELLEKKLKKKQKLGDFSKGQKRPDFVLLPVEREIQLIEIKNKKHRLQNEEMERIQNYFDTMTEFINDEGNKDFKAQFPGFKVTLVCDGIALSSLAKAAFEKAKAEGTLEHISWTGFLVRTRKANEEFLKEAERQKKLAVLNT